MTILNTQSVVGPSASLQALTGVFAAGDTAVVDAFSDLGDQGGGVFYFEGTTPDSAKIIAANTSSNTITDASNATPVVVTTSTNHGFVTGQAVLVGGVGGNTAANGKWIVKVISATQFSLNSSVGNGNYTSGGAVDSVVIETQAPHLRGNGQRLAVAGANWSSGTGINGQWDGLGVVSSTKLSIPASMTGSYVSGGIIGDNGFVVPTIPGRWIRTEMSPNNPRWFGAKGDGATDDLAAFVAAICAMGNTTTNSAGTLFVPPGTYYFSNTLNVTRPVRLVGAGSDRYIDTTVLKFADGVVGIMTWHGAMDSPDGGRADGASLESVTVTSAGRSSESAHGIWMRSPTRITNCHFTGFGGHGIYIASVGGGFPDNWHVQWTRCDLNMGDGIHVVGGDTNAGVCVGGDFQSNVGWGVYDSSFLGCSWVGCNASDNARGAFAVVQPASFSSLINCYSENDQPPNYLKGNTFVIGGCHEAGFTPDSVFFGGIASTKLQPATFRGLQNVQELASSGTSPPRVALEGTLVTSYVSIRLEITTAGYPGGIQPDWQVGTQAQARWSIDGGTTWTGPVNIPRADNAYVYGLSKIVLGTTGLTAVFTPGYYALDNVYTSTGYGGIPVEFMAGSQDGTFSVLSWRHPDGYAEGDNYPFRLRWNSSNKRWQFDWANSAVGGYFSSRYALPRPGTISFASLWFGNPAHEQHQIVAAEGSYAVGTQSWQNSTNSPVGWWNPGDFILNSSTSSRWPVAWRPSQRGGIASNPYGWNQPWGAGRTAYPGDSILMSGCVFRALTYGVTGATQPPTWPTTLGATVTETNGTYTIVWENVGPSPGVFDPLIVASPQMLVKDCSAGGTITLSANEIAHERYKLTGTPGAAFSVIVGAGAGGSWDRSVLNASSQAATVQASAGDPGVSVPAGGCYRVFHDGGAIVRVT